VVNRFKTNPGGLGLVPRSCSAENAPLRRFFDRKQSSTQTTGGAEFSKSEGFCSGAPHFCRLDAVKKRRPIFCSLERASAFFPQFVRITVGNSVSINRKGPKCFFTNTVPPRPGILPLSRWSAEPHHLVFRWEEKGGSVGFGQKQKPSRSSPLRSGTIRNCFLTCKANQSPFRRVQGSPCPKKTRLFIERPLG